MTCNSLFYWSQRAELNRRPTDYESVCFNFGKKCFRGSNFPVVEKIRLVKSLALREMGLW